MKIFYYQRPDRQPNFGDELNHWLWPQLRPDLFPVKASESEDTAVFVGTGTLLNNLLPAQTTSARKLIVFSTGAGYNQPLAEIPAHWTIHCVRGPLSAKKLGLPPEKAIADGGILVADLFSARSARQGCSFMPHIHYASDASDRWQQICQQANIRYIDPRWDIERVLKAISESEKLLAEAMHGAIVADALRVPWIPVITGPRIYTFKWKDWCASMNLPFRPSRMLPLTRYKRWGRGLRSGTTAARHWLGAAIEGPVTAVHYGLTGNDAAIARRLATLSQRRPYLSEEEIFQERLTRLQACLSGVC